MLNELLQDKSMIKRNCFLKPVRYSEHVCPIICECGPRPNQRGFQKWLCHWNVTEEINKVHCVRKRMHYFRSIKFLFICPLRFFHRGLVKNHQACDEKSMGCFSVWTLRSFGPLSVNRFNFLFQHRDLLATLVRL